MSSQVWRDKNGDPAQRYWTMRDGNRILIGNMTDRHLRNSLAMLERVRDSKIEQVYGPDEMGDPFIQMPEEYYWLQDEIERRRQDDK